MPRNMEDSQRRDAAYRTIGDTIVNIVGETKNKGVSGGALYDCTMRNNIAILTGLNMYQFEWLMSSLVDRGKLEKRGELYFSKVTK